MFSAIFLGIVQGLTEFLPISSSAHLAIIGRMMDSAKDPGATFTAITQIGTELAVLIYFRKDILSLISAWLKSPRPHTQSRSHLPPCGRRQTHPSRARWSGGWQYEVESIEWIQQRGEGFAGCIPLRLGFGGGVGHFKSFLTHIVPLPGHNAAQAITLKHHE